MVTIPTVSIPNSLATCATIGAPPVPVPPPMPAVTNTILVLSFSMFVISAILSSQAFLPISGFAPAPKPEVSVGPICTFKGIALASNAFISVLHNTKSTPSMP